MPVNELIEIESNYQDQTVLQNQEQNDAKSLPSPSLRTQRSRNTGNRIKQVTITVSGEPNGKTYLAGTYPQKRNDLYVVPVYDLEVSGTDSDGKKVSKLWDVLRFLPFLNDKNADGYKPRYPSYGKRIVMAGKTQWSQPILRFWHDYPIQNMESDENGAFVIDGGFMIHDGPDDLNETGWGSAGCLEVVGDKGFTRMKQFIYSISGSRKESMDAGLYELVNSKKLLVELRKSKIPPIIPVG